MRRVSGEVQKRIIFFISVLGLAAIVGLLLAIAGYNFMSVDDYSYIQRSAAQWRENHSIIQVLSTQLDYAKWYWHVWQGTFSMEWLGSSLMVMIAEEHYYFGTVIILVSMVVAESLLLMLIGMKGLGADFFTSGIVTCWCISLQILMAPYPVEAFYWLCGALLYTFGFALAAFLFSFVFLYLRRQDNKCSLGSILLQAGIILTSVLIGLGNYVTAIFVLSSYLVLMGWIWFAERFVKASVHRGLKIKVMSSLDFTLFLVAFMCNVLAPGNRARMTSAGAEDISALKAILKAVYESAEYICVNIHFPVILIMIIMIPFMVQMVEAKKYRYPLPVLVSVVSFGIYASQFVPTIYTLGILGAGRVQNLYRFSLYLWLFGNELYWIGFTLRLLREEQDCPIKLTGWKNNYLLPIMMMELIILGFGYTFWGWHTLSAVSAFNSLRTGQAAQYRAEYDARLELLRDGTVDPVYLEPFSDPPYLLFFGDIKADPAAWENGDVAMFYGKTSVQLTHKGIYE